MVKNSWLQNQERKKGEKCNSYCREGGLCLGSYQNSNEGGLCLGRYQNSSKGGLCLGRYQNSSKGSQVVSILISNKYMSTTKPSFLKIKKKDIVDALVEANSPQLFIQLVSKTSLSKDDKLVALEWAIEEGHTQVLEHFLKDNTLDLTASFNDINKTTPLKAIIKSGNSAFLALFLQKSNQIDPSVIDNYAIRIASENGMVDSVKLLLKDPRVDPADLDSYALRMASKNNHYAVVDMLLQDGRSDPSSDRNFCLCIAAKSGFRSIMGLFLHHHPEVTPDLLDFKYHHLTSDQQFYLIKEIKDIKDGTRPTPMIKSGRSGVDPVLVFEMEIVLAKRQVRLFGKIATRSFEYLIKWKGFENEEDQTWVLYQPSDPEWDEDIHLIHDFEKKEYRLLPPACFEDKDNQDVKNKKRTKSRGDRKSLGIKKSSPRKLLFT